MVVPVSRGNWKTHTYLGEFCEFYELLDAQSTALATNSFQGLLKGYRRVTWMRIIAGNPQIMSQIYW